MGEMVEGGGKVGDYAYKLKLNRGYIELSVNV